MAYRRIAMEAERAGALVWVATGLAWLCLLAKPLYPAEAEAPSGAPGHSEEDQGLSGEFAVQTIRAGVELTWEAEPGLEYVVWWTRGLDPPSWEMIASVPATFFGASARYFDSSRTDACGFYRIAGQRPMVLIPGADGGGVHYDFWIGKYNVTNAEFARFLGASMGNAERYHDQGQRICYAGGRGGVFGAFPIMGQENHPVVQVSGEAAFAYSNWLSEQEGLEPVYREEADWQPDMAKNGYRLPTVAEWYKAACWDPTKEGTGGFWRYACRSDVMRGSLANYEDSGDPFEALRIVEYGRPPYHTTPVGFYDGSEHKVFLAPLAEEPSFQTEDAATYYGCYDISGNVSERVMLYDGASWQRHSMGSNWYFFDPREWDISRSWPVHEPDDGSSARGFRLARIAKPNP